MSTTTTNQKNNQILDNWDPRDFGFKTDFSRSEGNILNTFYKLSITDEMSIHISCSQFPDHPDIKKEQVVEICIGPYFELLPHITNKQRMAILIRSLSGKSVHDFI